MTEYNVLVNAFKDSINDPDLIQYSQMIQTDMMHNYINYACGKFNRICKKDLSDRSDEIEQFRIQLDDDEISILVNWMVECWARPIYNNLENMRNHLNTKDFSQYSPANLLDKVRNTYNDAHKKARAEMIEYSYIHSDLERQKA